MEKCKKCGRTLIFDTIENSDAYYICCNCNIVYVERVTFVEIDGE